MRTMLFYSFLVLALMASCKSNSGAVEVEGTEKQPAYIQLSASTCRGSCPSFDFLIYENGEAHYVGKRHVDRMGDYKTTLTRDQHETILQSFAEHNFSEMDSSYLTQIRDLQRFEIRLRDKKIRYHKRNAPEALLALYAELSGLVEKCQWTKMD